MNFRLPFQISRVSAICQSSSPLNLVSKFTPIYESHVQNANQNKQNRANHARIITSKCSYKTFHSPFTILQQKAFLHDLAKTEEAVKQRVRCDQSCDFKIDKAPRLAFRQTSKVECTKCDNHRPFKAPPLLRPPKLYDDSKCQYEHKYNPELGDNKAPRMDDYCCLSLEKKNLPDLPDFPNCYPGIDIIKRPVLAPKLYPPEKWYDPEKMKWNHENCDEPKCVRRDDVCGYQVSQKELPPILPDDCQPCVEMRPLTAPVLRRPPVRYDSTCIPYTHSECPEQDKAPRRDSCLCEPVLRELPVLPSCHYIPCETPLPTRCPELKRPTARYDPMEMEYRHKFEEDPCEMPSLRRDNQVISVTVKKKKLPRLKADNTCPPCMRFQPLISPKLKPPELHNRNIAAEQERTHCIEEKSIRRDGHIQICRQCLPRVPISYCMRPPMDIFTPCTTPKFTPPTKLYDDSNCQYRHTCPPEDEPPPPRTDDYCLQIVPKNLPSLSNCACCKRCVELPTIAPKLNRPFKKYDDSTQKYRHPVCPDELCKTTPRADDYTGMKDEVKCLQPYIPIKCKLCQQYFPFKAPILCRPRARYDDTCMLYDHKNCPPCEGACFRRDHYLWEAPRKLPRLKCNTVCKLCQQSYPSTAPPIHRPEKLYDFPTDPVRIKPRPPQCPPRRDDLLCWKPRRKKLPSFKDCCNQTCCFSTYSWVNSKKTSMGALTNGKNAAPETKEQLKKEAIVKQSENQFGKEKIVPKETKKRKQSQSEDPYFIVNEPTWKCIDESNRKKSGKIYDYSIEKWLQKGAEYLIRAAPKSSSRKQSIDNVYNQLDYSCQYSTDTKCITPLKFTGFDTSESNKLLFIKKNNKLQPLKIGSAFKSKVTASQAKTCIPEEKGTTLNKEKNTAPNKEKVTTLKEDKKEPTTIAPKKSNKSLLIASIIQEHIKPHLKTTCTLGTNNFVLNLSNKMRSTLFQKISNFFKNREIAAAAKKAIKHKPSVVLPKKSQILKQEYIDDIYAKYDVDFNATDNLKVERNKVYFVHKFKNPSHKIKTDKNGAVTSKVVNDRKGEAIIKAARSLTNKINIKADHIRNFSTQSKQGPLCYKHIDISDDYIGKIYKVKLKKIGVKNLMLEKNDPDKRDEEPHTICYICKVVPRYQPIIHDDPPDIENVKINYYREKRNTIE